MSDTFTYQINPETIASITHDSKCIEVKFKDGTTTLKVRTAACVLATNSKLLVGRELVFPAALLLGGKPIADGKKRCAACDTELTAANHCDGYCWTCAKKLEGIDTAIRALKQLGVTGVEDKVHAYLTELKPADAALVKGEDVVNEVLKRN